MHLLNDHSDESDRTSNANLMFWHAGGVRENYSSFHLIEPHMLYGYSNAHTCQLKLQPSENLVCSLWLEMYTLAALPLGEGGGASELAFPVGDWERVIAMKADRTSKR
ncbi:MAG: hypothetical protein V7K35_04875 [Nostoc sp.]|uniref:hypothetical protein n=1 Tax=Nostoc sp. TaxID=1180 RepID=UPI002FFBA24A